jgi:light-independent protochlorophyllide reductase subunit B
VGEAIALTSTGAANQAVLTAVEVNQDLQGITWSADGEAELKKIPFFVRGKIKRNTEKFASDRGITSITVETLYEAKAAIGK